MLQLCPVHYNKKTNDPYDIGSISSNETSILHHRYDGQLVNCHEIAVQLTSASTSPNKPPPTTTIGPQYYGALI